MRNRWLLSTACGLSLLAGSATVALAQNVPAENGTMPAGNGAASQIISLKPGQEAGTSTVMPADTAGNPDASMNDAQFVKRASAGGMAEVMMGKLAIQRGQTPAERNFGRMIVNDHRQADTALMEVAQTERLQPAQGPNAMQQDMYQRLQSVSAGQFDTMFNQVQIRVHRHTIAMFRAEARSGQSPQLRQFAQNTIPVLYQHLKMAERLSPAQSATGGMSAMDGHAGMSGNGMNGGMGMGSGMMGPATRAAINAPTSGNPNNSADQLNARELRANNQS